MNKDQDQKKVKPEQKQVPADEKQQINSTELTDADLEKVAGGGAQPHMVGNIKLDHK